MFTFTHSADKPLSKQQRDAALQRLREIGNINLECPVMALTFNAGNTNPPKEAIEQLRNELIPPGTPINQYPGLIIIAIQEGKKSWWLQEHIAKRLLKRFNGKFKILNNDNDKATAWTKMYYPSNMANWSRTHLVIAYNTDYFAPQEISITESGRHVEGFDQKGGLHATLSICGAKIGIIGAHLDSFSETERVQQAQALIDACRPANNERLDGRIFMGDLNYRFPTEVLNITPNTAPTRRNVNSLILNKSDILGNAHISDTIDRALTLLENNPKNPLSQFEHCRLPELTYCQTDNEGKLAPNKRRGNTYDAGPLDLVGISNPQHLLTKRLRHANDSNNASSDHRMATVIRPKDAAGKEISDHAAVKAEIKIMLPPRNQDKRKLNEIVASMDDIIRGDNGTRFLTRLHQAFVPAPNANSVRNSFENDNYLPNAQFSPDFLLWYFDYAAKAMRPSTDTSATYSSRFENAEVAMQDTLFIIQHLYALYQLTSPVNVEMYIKLIYDACLTIEKQTGNTGAYMSQAFETLLAAETDCPNNIRVKLLSPLRRWLDMDAHKVNRTQYDHYIGDDGRTVIERKPVLIRNNGMFHHTTPPTNGITQYHDPNNRRNR